MKNQFIKSVLVATIATSSITLYGIAFRNTTNEKLVIQEVFPASKNEKKLNKKRVYTQVFDLKSSRDLSHYHLQLRNLLPQYNEPTEKDILHGIQSHPNYIGKLPCLPSHDKNLLTLMSKRSSFYLFQLQTESSRDYYVAHSRGVRHFCINTKNGSVPGLDNSGAVNYPTLDRTIRDTLTERNLRAIV